MFNTKIKEFFCDRRIDDYYIKGVRGEITFNLDPIKFARDDQPIDLNYLFYIYTAYDKRLLLEFEESRTSQDDDVRLKERAEEYNKEHQSEGSGNGFFKIMKKDQLIIKIPEKNINKKYFVKKVSEGKDKIDLYISAGFDSYDVEVIDSEIKKESIDMLEQYNLKEEYNITIPFYESSWEDEIYDHLGPTEFFLELKSYIEMNADEILIPTSKYLNYLSSIGEMGANFNISKTFDTKKINRLRNDLNQYSFNPLAFFISELLNSLINTIYLEGRINKCQSCDDFIEYRKGKKFCSLISEGKDCGKTARNRRYYRKRKTSQK